jgi:hypothetical protein
LEELQTGPLNLKALPLTQAYFKVAEDVNPNCCFYSIKAGQLQMNYSNLSVVSLKKLISHVAALNLITNY